MISYCLLGFSLNPLIYGYKENCLLLVKLFEPSTGFLKLKSILKSGKMNIDGNSVETLEIDRWILVRGEQGVIFGILKLVIVTEDLIYVA